MTDAAVRELRAAAAALGFLTRIPLGRAVALDGDDVARASLWFPLAGAAIGAAVGGTAAGLDGPLGPLLAAALALALGAALTGALHLDGLADAADGLGGRTRAQALEIMRDHRIGAYGATALLFDVAVKLAALASLTSHVGAVVAAGALSRAVPVVLAAALPYARAGAGMGASLGTAARWRAPAAALLAVAVALLLAGADGLALAGVAAIGCAVLLLASRRWLGGVTGDTLGASSELVEAAVLVAAVALLA
jgi:adenosylcobinamide-GDP ribazoletransferase